MRSGWWREPKTLWLLMVSFWVVFMIGLGGYVRLSRAGLSIVEWNVVMGVFPPSTPAQWQAEFEKYQQSPEYRKINQGMSLEEYKKIFYIEWFHRLVGRLVGLMVVLPYLYWWLRRRLTKAEVRKFGMLVVLFLGQGVMGWLMVKSGLQDRPSVSHYRLMLHLLLALTILALSWTEFLRRAVRPPSDGPLPAAYLRTFRWFMILLIVQMIYGAFMAGLKAGHVSDTFPLMGGRWLPSGLLSILKPMWVNLVENPITVHFIHRWWAFVVLTVFLYAYFQLWRCCRKSALFKVGAALLLLLSTQIIFGIVVIMLNVPRFWGVLHQMTGALVFVLGLTMMFYHRRPVPSAVPAE